MTVTVQKCRHIPWTRCLHTNQKGSSAIPSRSRTFAILRIVNAVAHAKLENAKFGDGIIDVIFPSSFVRHPPRPTTTTTTTTFLCIYVISKERRDALSLQPPRVLQMLNALAFTGCRRWIFNSIPLVFLLVDAVTCDLKKNGYCNDPGQGPPFVCQIKKRQTSLRAQ